MAEDPDEPVVHRVRRWFFAEGHEYYPDWKKKRAIRRAFARTRATPIADAKPGLCLVGGHARVLRAVKCVALDAEVGAFWARSMADVRRFALLQPHEVTSSPIYDAWACGRFAVVDGSGVAIIAGDHVSLYRYEGRSRMRPPFAIAVTEGAEVTILGHAIRAPQPEAAILAAPGSYRAAPEVLVFRGTWLRPVVVLV